MKFGKLTFSTMPIINKKFPEHLTIEIILFILKLDISELEHLIIAYKLDHTKCVSGICRFPDHYQIFLF